MHSILSISKYEMKMQLKNAWLWALLSFAATAALIDNFPSGPNMKRLTYLYDQGYVVSRLLMHGGVLFLFGAMFFLSDRIRGDGKKGILELLMAKPLSKANFIWGKFIGNYAAILCMFAAYLLVNALVQYFFNPGPYTFVPYAVGFFAMSVPACFFVTACAVSLPAVVDIRFFYIVFSVYFLVNSGFIYTENSAIRSLFLFQRDLLKLVHTYAGFESINLSALLWNLAFLLCAGTGSMLLLQADRRFWRETA